MGVSVLLRLVMVLTDVEYLCGSIYEVSSRRTYLYKPLHEMTHPSLKSRDVLSSSWPKRLDKAKPNNFTRKTTNRVIVKNNHINVNITPSLSTKLVKASVENLVSTESFNLTGNMTSPFCELPTNLGPVTANKTEIKLSSIEDKFPEVSMGGWYKPLNCTAKHKVAIIIPYRDRLQQLIIFVNHMHPFLMKQQLDYGIFVIEQQGERKFNRATLFNVGFKESNRLRVGGWQCFVFHDVDLLPMDERNIYSCPRQPRHMSAAIDKFNYKLSYSTLFGGVSAMTYEQFIKVNGFSNKYWGWGGEDDDMSFRVRRMQYNISRYNMSIARYTMLPHKKQSPNPLRKFILSQTNKTFKKDGLSSLRYKRRKITKLRLFTLVPVNLDH